MRISDWSSDVCSSDLPVEHAAFGFVALAAIGRRRWPEAVEHAPPPRPLARGRLLAAADLLRILALLARRSTLCRWHFALGSLGWFREADLARQPAPIGEGARVLIRVAAVIRRPILRPLAPQRAGELATIGKVLAARSAERRVGKEGVRQCRTRGWTYHIKK